MLVDYKPFIDRVIHKYEGGYGWDAKDPGGPTKYGITCYDLAEHRNARMDSMYQWAPLVRDMSLAEAEEIYAVKYAAGIRFNNLPAGVDCCMLDYGINSGLGRPIRVARALLNQGSGDRLTDALVVAINAADPAWFIDSMCKERLHFLQGLRTWGTFGHGWASRVSNLEYYCKHLVTAGPVSPIDIPTTPVPKGVHPTVPVGPTVTKTAIGTGTAGAVVHATGLPSWAVFGLVAAGVAGGLAFVLWQAHQNSKAVSANANVVLPPTIGPHP